MLEHALDDRRGDRPAAAARVLDDAGDGDLGRVDGGEGDEPGVIPRRLGAAIRRGL